MPTPKANRPGLAQTQISAASSRQPNVAKVSGSVSAGPCRSRTSPPENGCRLASAQAAPKARDAQQVDAIAPAKIGWRTVLLINGESAMMTASITATFVGLQRVIQQLAVAGQLDAESSSV